MELLTWQTDEFEYYPKSNDWYWALGIITISSCVASIIYDNFLFSIFILLGGFSLAMFGVKHPRKITCSVNERGVTMDKTLYPYENIKGFTITKDKNPKLLLETSRVLMPILVIGIDEVDHDELRSTLLLYTTEEKIVQPFSDKIMDYLGF